jgi:hypothetical protein
VPSWTDGTVVFVDGALAPADQLRAVGVQAALLAAGSLSPDIVGHLGRPSSIVGRYLAVEGHRALAVYEDVLPTSVAGLIDPVTAARSSTAAASLAIARGKEQVTVAPAAFGTIRPRLVRTTRAVGVGGEGVRHDRRPSREQVLRELDDGEDATGGGGTDLLNPVGGAGVLGRVLQRLLGSSRLTGTGNPGAEAATHRTRRAERVARGAGASSGRAELPDHTGGLDHRGATYPEWDVFRRRYRADWCTVTEVEAEVSIAEVPLRPEATALRKTLSRLGLDLDRRHRQPQGDDIDIDATVEARVDLAAGAAPDQSIYIDSLRRRRGLSVLVLLDISGSAGEPSGSGGTVHEHQRAAATALLQALGDLGDRVALYGFRSQGRAAVHVVPVMRFGDRFDSLTLRRLHGLEPGAYTRLGAAIRHGASVLATDGGTVRRLLVVLSDGFAYDHGYEGAYAEADARRALAEARRRGTASLCLSIGAGTDAVALRRVFGTAAWAGLSRPDELSATAGPLFRTALQLADVQRRSSQRNERTRERLQVEGRSA